MKIIKKIKHALSTTIQNSDCLISVLIIVVSVLVVILPTYLANNFDLFDYDFIRSLSVIFLSIILLIMLVGVFSSDEIIFHSRPKIYWFAILSATLILLFTTFTLTQKTTIYIIDHPEISISQSGRDLSIKAVTNNNIKYIIDEKILFNMNTETTRDYFDRFESISTYFDYTPATNDGFGNISEASDINTETFKTSFGKVSFAEGYDGYSDYTTISIYPDDLNILDVINEQVKNVLIENSKINKIYISAGHDGFNMSIFIKNNKIIEMHF